MTKALDRPEKSSFNLFTFLVQGSPQTTVRYTNWDSPFDSQGLNFVSVPEIELKTGANTGTLNTPLAKLTMKITPTTTAFLEPLTRGTPHPPVDVLIEEITLPAQFGDEATRQVIYRGRVWRTIKNVGGRNDFVRIEVLNEKGQLDVALGFPANHHCAWRLFGPGCSGIDPDTMLPFGPDFSTAKNIGTLDVIDGKQITVGGGVTDAGTDRTYTRGWVQFNNTRIGVLFYDVSQEGTDPKVLLLVRTPPIEWLGKTIDLVPGCTKQIDGLGGCRLGWANEEQFGGSGFAIPAYNPIVENPQ